MKLSQQELDDVMLSLHAEMTKREPGEFTTLEYATKNNITTHNAYNILEKALVLGKVEKRQAGARTPIYWKVSKKTP